jgi:transposase-like protein
LEPADERLSRPEFHDPEKAREWLEAELWPNDPVCPRCGVINEATLMQGKSHRPGLYQCDACRKPFTITVGTLYERSHLPLNKWLAATHLMMASKKRIRETLKNSAQPILNHGKSIAWSFLQLRFRLFSVCP